jgi:hypothetical protein
MAGDRQGAGRASRELVLAVTADDLPTVKLLEYWKYCSPGEYQAAFPRLFQRLTAGVG